VCFFLFSFFLCLYLCDSVLPVGVEERRSEVGVWRQGRIDCPRRLLSPPQALPAAGGGGLPASFVCTLYDPMSRGWRCNHLSRAAWRDQHFVSEKSARGSRESCSVCQCTTGHFERRRPEIRPTRTRGSIRLLPEVTRAGSMEGNACGRDPKEDVVRMCDCPL
jgi:hypothetical protein